MAHKLLEKYPHMDGDFLFVNVNTFPKYLYPILKEPPTSPVSQTAWEYYNTIKDNYLNAVDSDFCFFCGGHLCDEAYADEMWFRTALESQTGEDIWIVSKLNSNPKSKWYGKLILVASEPKSLSLSQGEPLEVQTEEQIPVTDARADDTTLPLIQRYPSLYDLVFLHNERIENWLFQMTPDTTSSTNRVRNLFEERYKTNGEDVCYFYRDGQQCMQDEADTFYFDTGLLSKSGEVIYLQCERNSTLGREPWFGKYFNTNNRQTGIKLKQLFERICIFRKHVEYGLSELTTDIDSSMFFDDICERIANRFASLQPEEVLYFDETRQVESETDAKGMVFPTGYKSADGEEIMLRCERNLDPKITQPWISRRFYLPSQNAFHGRHPRKWLFSWAVFPNNNPSNMGGVLKDLKELAMYENWSIGQGNGLSVLYKYFVYTFARLWRENKVIETKKYAAFNTGLVNRYYEYIYAMFVPVSNPGADIRKWRFYGFCIDAQDRLGKELSRYFPVRPQPARYFDPREPIYFSFSDTLPIKAQIPSYDADHILLERTYRLPTQFLLKHAGRITGLPEKLDEISQLPANDSKERNRKWLEVSKMLRSSDDVVRSMRDSLDKAIEVAVRRAVWNYRTVIPYYTPADDRISLLLPISLTEYDVPDFAMVLELNSDSGQIHYFGHTIITLAMAYSNARLVCRPESDWLNIQLVNNTRDAITVEDDEDEEP